MKKILHPTFLPLLVPLAGILGMALRLWTMGGGPDAAGLYPRQPLPWILLWLVTALTVVGIYVLTRRLKNPGRYSDNYPASSLGAAGCVAGGASILYCSITTLTTANMLLPILSGWLGILAGVCLLGTAVVRFRGSKPTFVLHLVPCLYFALRIFDSCRHWSNITQSGLFIFQFLASVCIMLATYQMCCFDVNLGNRRSCLLWSLSGVYFCALSLPVGEDLWFYGGMMLWLMTNLCAVHPLKSNRSITPEAPVECETVQVSETVQESEPAAATTEEPTVKTEE